MAIAHEPFRCEIEEAEDASRLKTTLIRLHGRLMRHDAGPIKQLIAPVIARGDRVVIDSAELDYLDSSGLGVLVSLKLSANQRGPGTLHLINLSPRVRQLLSNTNLLDLFSA